MTKILFIPEKSDAERDAVARAWTDNIGEVRRLGKFWIKPSINANDQCSIYGNDTFALVLAQILGLELLTVDERTLMGISKDWTKRNITLTTVHSLSEVDFPNFYKPLIPKTFKANVYDDKPALKNATHDIDGDTQLMQSEIIDIEGEVRCFVKEREIIDTSLYSGNCAMDDALRFADHFVNSRDRDLLPSSFVMDLGYNNKDQFFIIEFNSVWASGLNGCDPYKVLTCIEDGTRLRAQPLQS